MTVSLADSAGPTDTLLYIGDTEGRVSRVHNRFLPREQLLGPHAG